MQTRCWRHTKRSQYMEYVHTLYYWMFDYRSPKHQEWIRGLRSIFEALKAYVTEFYRTGLTWNPKVARSLVVLYANLLKQTPWLGHSILTIQRTLRLSPGRFCPFHSTIASSATTSATTSTTTSTSRFFGTRRDWGCSRVCGPEPWRGCYKGTEEGGP